MGDMHTHANTIVQLVHNAQFLVAGCIARNGEGSIVCAHFCDVAVLSVAEFWVVVASGRVGNGWSAAGSSRGGRAVSSNLCQGIRVRSAGDLRVGGSGGIVGAEGESPGAGDEDALAGACDGDLAGAGDVGELGAGEVADGD